MLCISGCAHYKFRGAQVPQLRNSNAPEQTNETCSFPGGGANDGVCDEASGWCLPGTDSDDCQGTKGDENYIYNLWTSYYYDPTVCPPRLQINIRPGYFVCAGES